MSSFAILMVFIKLESIFVYEYFISEFMYVIIIIYYVVTLTSNFYRFSIAEYINIVDLNNKNQLYMKFKLIEH